MPDPARPPEKLTVAVLAGGRGSRLGGIDKAALDVAGRPLLERVLDAVEPLACQVLVIANDDRLVGDPRFAVVRDPESHAGVLPGLLAALDTASSPLLLLVACDMPFLSRAVVSHLLELAAHCDVVMPYVDGFDQPMHAIYRVAPCRAAIRSAIARGDRRMISFLEDVITLRVESAELSRLDPRLLTFFNVNTPNDLDQARQIVAGEQR